MARRARRGPPACPTSSASPPWPNDGRQTSFVRALTLTRCPLRFTTPPHTVSIITSRINYLQEHIAKSKKDNAAKRGLMGLLVQRHRLLAYLKRTNVERFQMTLDTLGIRERATLDTAAPKLQMQRQQRVAERDKQIAKKAAFEKSKAAAKKKQMKKATR